MVSFLFGQLCLRTGALEVRHIEREGGVRSPLNCLGRGVQIIIGVGKCLAQTVQQRAQVALSLGVGRVGPEQEGELLARRWHGAMQDEIGQQLLEARRINARNRAIIEAEVEPIQKLNVQSRVHRHSQTRAIYSHSTAESPKASGCIPEQGYRLEVICIGVRIPIIP